MKIEGYTFSNIAINSWFPSLPLYNVIASSPALSKGIQTVR